MQYREIIIWQKRKKRSQKERRNKEKNIKSKDWEKG